MKGKKPTKSSSTAPIVNRRARFDYELGEEIVAGLVLTGPETRAARDGHIQLKGSYVTIKNDELDFTPPDEFVDLLDSLTMRASLS